MLYNLSFNQSRVPKLWKHANVTPVHKDGDREPAENYRSISLLSIQGKCQERIVYQAVYDQVFQLVHSSHHGFLKGRSCTTQLLVVHHDWSKTLDCRGQVHVVFLDFSKAFDLVDHTILLSKLYKYGIHGNLLKWCKDYLTDRQEGSCAGRIFRLGNRSLWISSRFLIGTTFF